MTATRKKRAVSPEAPELPFDEHVPFETEPESGPDEDIPFDLPHNNAAGRPTPAAAAAGFEEAPFPVDESESTEDSPEHVPPADDWPYGDEPPPPAPPASAGSISERRPRDFPEETAQAFVNGIWYLPGDATTATLIIGEDDEILEVPVSLAVETGPVIRPSQTFTFALTGLTRAGELTAESRLNGTDVPGRQAATTGTMLRLDFDATPAFSTDTDAQAGDNQAFLRNTWFSLVGPDGAPLVAAGSQSGSNATPRIEWTNSISWDSSPRTVDLSLHFLGSGTPGTYQLYFLEDIVGEITLQ